MMKSKIPRCSDCHQRIEADDLDSHLRICLGEPEASSIELPGNVVITAMPRRSQRLASIGSPPINDKPTAKKSIVIKDQTGGGATTLIERVSEDVNTAQQTYTRQKIYQKVMEQSGNCPTFNSSPLRRSNRKQNANHLDESQNENYNKSNSTLQLVGPNTLQPVLLGMVPGSVGSGVRTYTRSPRSCPTPVQHKSNVPLRRYPDPIDLQSRFHELNTYVSPPCYPTRTRIHGSYEVNDHFGKLARNWSDSNAPPTKAARTRRSLPACLTKSSRHVSGSFQYKNSAGRCSLRTQSKSPVMQIDSTEQPTATQQKTVIQTVILKDGSMIPLGHLQIENLSTHILSPQSPRIIESPRVEELPTESVVSGNDLVQSPVTTNILDIPSQTDHPVDVVEPPPSTELSVENDSCVSPFKSLYTQLPQCSNVTPTQLSESSEQIILEDFVECLNRVDTNVGRPSANKDLLETSSVDDESVRNQPAPTETLEAVSNDHSSHLTKENTEPTSDINCAEVVESCTNAVHQITDDTCSDGGDTSPLSDTSLDTVVKVNATSCASESLHKKVSPRQAKASCKRKQTQLVERSEETQAFQKGPDLVRRRSTRRSCIQETSTQVQPDSDVEPSQGPQKQTDGQKCKLVSPVYNRRASRSRKSSPLSPFQNTNTFTSQPLTESLSNVVAVDESVSKATKENNVTKSHNKRTSRRSRVNQTPQKSAIKVEDVPLLDQSSHSPHKQSQVLTQDILADTSQQMPASSQPVETSSNCKSKSKQTKVRKTRVSKKVCAADHTDTVLVDCGKCGEKGLSLTGFEQHAIRNHNGLARPQGQSQQFTDHDALALISKTIRQLKKIQCLNCNKTLSSYYGAEYHYLICGRTEEEKVKKCVFCDEMIRVSRFAIHRAEHGKAAKQPVQSADDLTAPRPKRKSTATSFVGIVDSDGQDSDAGSHEDYDPKQDNPDLLAIIDPQKVTSTMITKWKCQLKESGECLCPNALCAEQFSCTKDVRFHVRKSCKLGKTLYACEGCSYSCENKRNVEDHIEKFENHPSHMNGKPVVLRGPKPVSKLSSYFDMTRKFRAENYSEKLFDELTVEMTDWSELSATDADMYAPKMTESSLFQSTKQSQTTSKDVWQPLELYGQHKDPSGSIIFTGGPIVSSAWCPIPDNVQDVPQYIALSVNLTPNHKYPQPLCRRGVIQIWQYDEQEARLALSLVLDYGTARSLEWCPSGIYDQKRLGLLAAACDDGSIRLFVIPHLQQFATPAKTYRKTPDMTLTYAGYECFAVPCTKLSWCRGKGHRFLLGGYKNGYVSKYNLSTKSQDHLSKDANGKLELRAIQRIFAHSGYPVSSLSFKHTSDGRHIVTCGYDRCVKFWDTYHPSNPKDATRKGISLDSYWSVHWPGVYVAFDDMGGINKNATIYKGGGNPSRFAFPVMYSNSPVWSISGSDWFNALAQLDEAGAVSVTFQRDMICESVSEKFCARTQHPIMSIASDYLDCDSVFNKRLELLREPAETRKSAQEIDRLTMPSFEDVAKRTRVRVLDHDANIPETPKHAYPPHESNEDFAKRIRTHTITHSKSLAWNANYSARKLLFVGSNSGIGKFVQMHFPDFLMPKKNRHQVVVKKE